MLEKLEVNELLKLLDEAAGEIGESMEMNKRLDRLASYEKKIIFDDEEDKALFEFAIHRLKKVAEAEYRHGVELSKDISDELYRRK